MAKPTLQQIADQSRSLLGDDDVAGGTVFTNTVLQPHIAQAIREIFRVLRGTEDPFVLQDVYYQLPADTVVLDPASMGISDFGDVEWVGWQLGTTQIPITSVIIGTDLATHPAAQVVAPNHGFKTGATIVVSGVGGFDYFNNPNNLWTITVKDVNTFFLEGCTATGTYTSGGTAQALTGQFTPMQPVDRLDMVAATPGAFPVNIYAWQGGVLRFLPATQPMLLRITYRTSGAVPSNPAAVIPIEDSQDYLATRAAGIAAKTRGAAEVGAALTADALGPSLQADGNGGILRQLVQVDVRNMQRIQYRLRSFRARRNSQDLVLF